jgi:PEP-CTERM motif
MKMRSLGTYVFVAVAACLLLAVTASADIITFEDQPPGPSLFGGPAETLTYLTTTSGTLTITGGTVLTNATNAPADETTIYGTCSCGSYLNTITLTWTAPITNFFMDLYNGQTNTDTYTVTDNVGDTASFTIAPNLSSGVALVSLPAAGTMVTITTSDPAWDFAIDNVGFDQATPTVPEPSSFALLGVGLAALACFTLRRQLA